METPRALLAFGVVYGDIGTSPLNAARETFNPDHGIPFTPANVIGGVSAMFWSLMILALAMPSVGARSRVVATVRVVGVFGAALSYGDAVYTPRF